jgi:outer membrane protein OmpA-like peptidoglycan-associated protein
MRYLTIGPYKTDDWPNRHLLIDNPVYFFVDDVSIKRINEDTLDTSITPTPYCEYYKKEERIRDAAAHQDTSIYFETNSAILDDKDKVILDSFYSRTLGNPGKAYVLSGHTDSRGHENEQLSEARTMAVEHYLMETYGISQFKFIAFPQGSTDPAGDNNTEKGRAQNRRVTISNSEIPTNAAVYRQGLHFLQTQEYSEAMRMFNIWLQTVPLARRMEILHDERVRRHMPEPQWGQLVKGVRKSYDSYVRKDDAFFLDSLYFVDQRYRMFSPMPLTGFILGLDTFRLDGVGGDFGLVHRKDSVNTLALFRYLDKNPFPKISEVGRRQARAAGLIIQHQADTALFDKYLPIVEANCRIGEADWEIYALMFDRNEIYSGRPQHYGTQGVVADDGKTISGLAPLIDDLESVNVRRKKFGLHVIQQY